MNLVINVMQVEGSDKIIINLSGKRIVKDFKKDLYEYLIAQESLFAEAKTVEEAKAILSEVEEAINSETVDSKTRINEYLVYDKKDNAFYLALGNQVSSWPMPETFAQRIIKTREKNLDVKPLVKAWIRLLRNPNVDREFIERFCGYVNSKYVDKKLYTELVESGINEDTAKEMATCYDVAITVTGLLATNKYARIVYHKFDKETGEQINRYETEFNEDSGIKMTKLPENIEDYTLEPPVMGQGGEAFYSGEAVGHHISVGKVHRLPSWNSVDLNHDRMEKGLWLGGLSYIQGYGGRTEVLLQCFVDPAKIGSFYKGSEFSAIKVLEYFVHSAVDIPNKALYHESTYAEQTEKEWSDDATKAIETLNDMKKKFSEQIEGQIGEISALKTNI